MCSCFCGCIKNFAVRIIYIIVIVIIFVVLGLIPLDAMTAYGGFIGIPKDVNVSQVNASDIHNVNLDGIIYKITWIKNGLTLFSNGSNQTCAAYTPKNTTLSGNNISIFNLDEKFTKLTILGKYNVSCFSLNGNEKLLDDLAPVFFGTLGAVVALAFVAVIAILCVFICCAGWCSCSCCFLCKSCCLLRG